MARLVIESWDIVISVVVCSVISAFMVWVLFRVLQWKPHYEVSNRTMPSNRSLAAH